MDLVRFVVIFVAEVAFIIACTAWVGSRPSVNLGATWRRRHLCPIDGSGFCPSCGEPTPKRAWCT